MGTNVLPFGPRDPAVNRQEIVDILKRLLDENVDLKTFPTNFKLALSERVWEGDRLSASGKILAPVSFHEFIHEQYPVGIGATYEIVENLIRGRNDVLALWTDVTKRKAGAPEGNRNAVSSDDKTTLYNVQDCIEAPSGNSSSAGLRRIQKDAAEGKEEAAAKLAEIVSGNKSVHRAAVELGHRKDTRIDPDIRDRAAQALAERIVSNFPADELDSAKADAFACGAKALGIALSNLIGQSIMDRRFR